MLVVVAPPIVVGAWSMAFLLRQHVECYVLINPRRACAGELQYLSCVSVCLSVCYNFFGYIVRFYARIQVHTGIL